MAGNADTIERAEPGDVVVGIDDSPSSEAALDWAAQWARAREHSGPTAIPARHLAGTAATGSAR